MFYSFLITDLLLWVMISVYMIYLDPIIVVCYILQLHGIRLVKLTRHSNIVMSVGTGVSVCKVWAGFEQTSFPAWNSKSLFNNQEPFSSILPANYCSNRSKASFSLFYYPVLFCSLTRWCILLPVSMFCWNCCLTCLQHCRNVFKTKPELHPGIALIILLRKLDERVKKKVKSGTYKIGSFHQSLSLPVQLEYTLQYRTHRFNLLWGLFCCR